MQRVSFRRAGHDCDGAIVGDRTVDLHAVFGDRAPDLRSRIAQGLVGEASPAAADAPAVTGDVRWLPVIPNPGKIVGVGLNDGDLVRDTHREATAHPTLCIRVAESQVAHGEAMVLPRESDRFDDEGEIAIVIGQGGRRLAEADAWRHVAGDACYDDGSIRDWQDATPQRTAGENFWRTGAFGSWMVTRDKIADDRVMARVTRLNGVEMQRTTTDRMIRSIPRRIAHRSTFVPIAPGDVVVTGTPGGVGARRTPPVRMKAGDVVDVEVDAIGVLRNTIAAE